ncbi:MAG: hypothetical protein A2Y38_16680 [Spirochaetes bacterium GWB1_59_5]|nr:MAG: hypothetical protein A2Y38_16680 [Spirochaetes bacterium GWB1_59_5]
MSLVKSPEAVKQALREYEQVNAWVEPPLRRLLALCALTPKFGKRVTEQALGKKLPNLVLRDPSWRYWNCLHLAGLGDQWPDLVQATYNGGTRHAVYHLRRMSGTDPYRRFRSLLGSTSLSNKPVTQHLWTKGGNWFRRYPPTQLYVLKEHPLDLRKYRSRKQTKLGSYGVELLEHELMNLVNPDALLSYECKQLGLTYLRRRWPEMIREKGRVSLEEACWFFQSPVPYTPGKALEVDERTGYVHERYDKSIHNEWSW